MRRENAKNSTDSVDPDKDSEETFLGRWSRRKQRVRAESDEPADSGPPATAAPDAEIAQDSVPERVLTDDDMPPLESLDADSDYSGFLSPGVSEALRNAALKKMFLSPKYNIVDGLDDYADDFTKFEPLGDIITADMRHQMELAEERAKKALEDELAPSNEEGLTSDTDNEHAHERDKEEMPAASAENPAAADNDQADGAATGDAPDDEPRSG